MYEDRVCRGAALLDRIRPGWGWAIDGDRLAMETWDRDILGQLWGDFVVGWFEHVRPVACRREIVPPSAFGFTLTALEQAPLHGPARFAALTAAWRAEIARRVDAGVTVA